ncbi:MAG TPA: dethiobiotin synthase [Flavobacterium sp.]|jgi:dethiobiotin synthetase
MKLFITGISTDVGKTIASAIITEALEADYWKPVQAGDLDNSDSMKVRRLISNTRSKIHPEAYRLNTPASPHLSAKIDGVSIQLNSFIVPETENHLVIEGAGGVFVPLNESQDVIDLIAQYYKVIVVSRHYLGSINHTLLTVEALKNRNFIIGGIIFNGEANPSSEEIIIKKTGVPIIGRIEQEPYFDQNVISEYADMFRPELNNIT